ncbi:MAG: trypsin-like peptidase domain-containing protein [Balneolaceae bacterium]
MKRQPFYSSSERYHQRRNSPESRRYSDDDQRGESGDQAGPADSGRWSHSWREFRVRNETYLLIAACAVLPLLILGVWLLLNESPAALTQRDIDMAVLHSLENMPPSPSWESLAYEAIRPSIVRVRRVDRDENGEDEIDRGVGTGVVVEDDGTILTNLHVVAGSERTVVVFADGSESDADIVGIQPENDLAVIRARQLPDDLMPATLRSTSGLREGDHVIAVGYPFGIGPSVSSGIISGLGREYVSEEGEPALTGLIQFDAAANPGNSGGPLVTREGEVVGIVTAILNHSGQRVFIGIGFAVPIESATESMGSSPF